MLPAQLTPAQLARLTAIRNRAIQDAEQYVRSRIFALEQMTVNELYDTYLGVFGQLSGAMVTTAMQYGAGETWSFTDAAFRARTEQLLAQIDAEIRRLIQASTDMVMTAAERAYQAGLFGAGWTLDMGLRTGAFDLPLVPVEAMRAAILFPYQGMTFLDRFANARAEFERLIRSAIVESQALGETIYQAQKRLARSLGIDISRRTPAARAANQGLFYKTEQIARTEILRASNLGALSVYERNQDVLNGWQWKATLDERTCPTCGALDGQVFAFDAAQSPPPTGSHPLCRCAVTPVLKDSALEQAIVGPRETYEEWAAARGITITNDGGVLRFQRGAAPPKSPSAAAIAKIFGPSGIPVGRSITVPGGPKMQPIRDALAAIDRVHGDGELPVIPVSASTARTRYGAYWWNHAGGADKITIKTVEDHVRMTMAHEMGHFIDHMGIGTPGVWASPKSDLLEEWRKAITNSEAFKALDALSPAKAVMIKMEDGREFAQYYDRNYLGLIQSTKEYFARSYAQYIATRSGDTVMMAELDRLLATQRVTLQWTEADFKDIASAYDKLFEFLGWRT